MEVNTELVTDHHVGQVRMPPSPDLLDMRSLKVPNDRPRFSSRRDRAPKRSSFERNGPIEGRRRSPLSKSRRYSSFVFAAKISRYVFCTNLLYVFALKTHKLIVMKIGILFGTTKMLDFIFIMHVVICCNKGYVLLEVN